MVTVDLDACARVWDCDTGRHRFRFAAAAAAERVTCAALDAAGQRLLTGDDTGSVRVWHVLNGRCLKQLAGHRCVSARARGGECRVCLLTAHASQAVHGDRGGLCSHGGQRGQAVCGGGIAPGRRAGVARRWPPQPIAGGAPVREVLASACDVLLTPPLQGGVLAGAARARGSGSGACLSARRHSRQLFAGGWQCVGRCDAKSTPQQPPARGAAGLAASHRVTCVPRRPPTSLLHPVHG